MMGNEATKKGQKVSVIGLVDRREMTKLLSEGTNVIICDVEIAREGEVRRWMSDLIHGTRCSNEILVEQDALMKKVIERKEVRLIVPLKSLPWEKQSQKTLATLSKYLPLRRFSLSRYRESQFIIQESLPRTVRFMLTFRDTTDINRFAVISVLSFHSRLESLWSSFSRNTVHSELTELLVLSISHDILMDKSQHTLSQIFSHEPRRSFGSLSIVFVVIILAAISSLVRSKGSKEIQQFLQGHYSEELHDAVHLQLRTIRRLSLRDVRMKIALNCGVEIHSLDRRILDSKKIDSEVRVEETLETEDDGNAEFEEMYSDCMDDLLRSIPDGPTMHGRSSIGNSTPQLPNHKSPEHGPSFTDFIKFEPFTLSVES